MTYFSNFPNIAYEFNSKISVVKDILRRATFTSEYKPYTDLYTPYTILEGETPQSVADFFYGSPSFHWVVLIFNEIHNPYFDWPLDQLSVDKLCTEKYGDNVFVTKHYELNGSVVGEVKDFSPDFVWVPPSSVGLAVPITFYEYEHRINDEKRYIQIMRPELLSEFVQQFEVAING